MKRLIITLVIVAICAAASGAELTFVSHKTDSVLRGVESADALVRRGSYSQAAAICKTICRRWEEASPAADALLIHDYVDSVGLELRRMQTFAEHGCSADYFSSSEGVKKGLASLKGSEYPHIENIL